MEYYLDAMEYWWTVSRCALWCHHTCYINRGFNGKISYKSRNFNWGFVSWWCSMMFWWWILFFLMVTWWLIMYNAMYILVYMKIALLMVTWLMVDGSWCIVLCWWLIDDGFRCILPSVCCYIFFRICVLVYVPGAKHSLGRERQQWFLFAKKEISQMKWNTQYIWVNYTDLTVLPHWKSWLVREIISNWPNYSG